MWPNSGHNFRLQKNFMMKNWLFHHNWCFIIPIVSLSINLNLWYWVNLCDNYLTILLFKDPCKTFKFYYIVCLSQNQIKSQLPKYKSSRYIFLVSIDVLIRSNLIRFLWWYYIKKLTMWVYSEVENVFLNSFCICLFLLFFGISVIHAVGSVCFIFVIGNFGFTTWINIFLFFSAIFKKHTTTTIN